MLSWMLWRSNILNTLQLVASDEESLYAVAWGKSMHARHICAVVKYGRLCFALSRLAANSYSRQVVHTPHSRCIEGFPALNVC